MLAHSLLSTFGPFLNVLGFSHGIQRLKRIFKFAASYPTVRHF